MDLVAMSCAPQAWPLIDRDALCCIKRPRALAYHVPLVVLDLLPLCHHVNQAIANATSGWTGVKRIAISSKHGGLE